MTPINLAEYFYWNSKWSKSFPSHTEWLDFHPQNFDMQQKRRKLKKKIIFSYMDLSISVIRSNRVNVVVTHIESDCAVKCDKECDTHIKPTVDKTRWKLICVDKNCSNHNDNFVSTTFAMILVRVVFVFSKGKKEFC